MKRITISPEAVEAAKKAVPAPTDHAWFWDPALSGDRLRLFTVPDGGEVCVAYGSGSWAVNSLTEYPYAAQGTEESLEDAMLRALKVARAIGWKFS